MDTNVALKSKVELKDKGATAAVEPNLKAMMVTLSWKKDVDLDLMAFGKTKSGDNIAVFSNNIVANSQGDINVSPFIHLDDDAGVGAVGGDNAETMRIAKLDDIDHVFITTLNYSDAAAKRAVAFSAYDGNVAIMQQDKDNQTSEIDVPLNSDDPGHLIVIAKIDNTNPMGATVENINKVYTLEQAVAELPGFNKITG